MDKSPLIEPAVAINVRSNEFGPADQQHGCSDRFNRQPLHLSALTNATDFLYAEWDKKSVRLRELWRQPSGRAPEPHMRRDADCHRPFGAGVSIVTDFENSVHF